MKFSVHYKVQLIFTVVVNYYSHVNSENRSHYQTVMEDIIPLENALMTKQQVGKGSFISSI